MSGDNDRRSLLRLIPKVDDLARDPAILDAAARAGVTRPILIRAIQETAAAVRDIILNGTQAELAALDLSPAGFAARAREALAALARPSVCRVVNATGVVLHTNLGRAVLARAAREAVAAVASNYSSLELDLETGERGSRQAHVRRLLCELTGAESALVVNNNAAAVLLVLDTLARGREAIVSRGELVEIGGSFRVPKIMEKSGARLVEVGTTNKTYLRDYEEAIGPDTAILLKVHPSNYRMVGFTRSVDLVDLVTLGQKHGIPVVEDQGSGVLIDLAPFGLDAGPTIRAAVQAGADLVTASGDKLLGGPQAGIIAGRRKYIEAIAANPLARALRIDKLSLAGLEATLRLYRDEETARREIPVLAMLTAGAGDIRPRAEALARLIVSRARAAAEGVIEVEVVSGTSAAGGGSLPGEELATWLVAVRPTRGEAGDLEAALRRGDPPVLARVQGGRVLFDPRTLADGELEIVAAAVAGFHGGEVP